MLWRQHDALDENLTKKTLKYPPTHEMRGSLYCTSTNDIDEYGNPCPKSLCSCEEEIPGILLFLIWRSQISGFSALHDNFFEDEALNPLVNLDVQRQWWKECFAYEYGRPLDKMNEHTKQREQGVRSAMCINFKLRNPPWRVWAM